MQNETTAIGSVSSDTGARLGAALLGYMLAITLVVTLLPFHFAWPTGPRIMLVGEPHDMVANVVLFVPLGFFYALAKPPSAGTALRVFLLGAATSLAIETVQYFEPVRTPSPVDVVTNAIGACLGAIAAGRVARAVPRGGHVVGWLALQLPLMGLVYLMVPLLWIGAVSAADDLPRRMLASLLALVGAILLGGMQRHYFGPIQRIPPHRTAIYAALWFVAGAFPALARRSEVVIAGALVAALACWLLGRRAAGSVSPGNRRFETSLLTAAAPLYAAYLALLVVLPLRAGLQGFELRLGFPNVAVVQSEIMRLMELASAFTLAGYMLAEFRGRQVQRYRDAVPRLLAYAVGLACCVEALWGFRDGHGGSVARACILASAGLYGGWLYYLQRAHVVRLLARASASSPEPARAGMP